MHEYIQYTENENMFIQWSETLSWNVSHDRKKKPEPGCLNNADSKELIKEREGLRKRRAVYEFFCLFVSHFGKKILPSIMCVCINKIPYSVGYSIVPLDASLHNVFYL